jgi:hypothetical protein
VPTRETAASIKNANGFPTNRAATTIVAAVAHKTPVLRDRDELAALSQGFPLPGRLRASVWGKRKFVAIG